MSNSNADARARNRADFPETAKMIDEYRRVFGAGVRLVWAKEGGRTIGNPPQESNEPPRAES